MWLKNLVNVMAACVGTAFKKDGKFENFVEKQRVMEFMDVVKAYRCTMKEGV